MDKEGYLEGRRGWLGCDLKEEILLAKIWGKVWGKGWEGRYPGG